MEHRPATVRISDSDIDFDDVFGGPPTWTRYSYSGSRIKSSTSSSSGSVERPVFVEPYSWLSRRTSDDFFDDIFRSSGESDRSPRWCSPASGSTTLNPTKIQPFATSIPPEISLPAKMTKDLKIPVFGSSTETQFLRNNSGQSPGQTLLSRESSSVTESLYSTKSTENEIDLKSKSRSESPSSEFQFSMHKWANLGGPLLMSFCGGKHLTLQGSSKVSALSIDDMHDSGFPDEDLSAEKQEMNPVSGISLMK